MSLGNLFSSCSAGTVKHQVFHHRFEAALGQRLRKEEGWQINSCSQARLSDSSFISWRKVSQNKKQKHRLGKHRARWNRIAEHFSLCVLLSLIVQRILCSRQSWQNRPVRREGLVWWGAWIASGAESDCTKLGVRLKAIHKGLGAEISSANSSSGSNCQIPAHWSINQNGMGL